MRVLHVYSGNLFGGLESMLVTIARQPPASGGLANEFALCFRQRLADELTTTGCAVHHLGAVKFSRPWTSWRANRRLAALLADRPFDAVICHSPWPYALFSKTVGRTHCLNVFWTHQYLDGLGRDQRMCAKQTPDLVICNSRYSQRSVQTLLGTTASEVVYCPHAIAAPVDAAATTQRIRSETQTPQDSVVILQASRMESWKGQRLLLAALARVRANASWVLWLAGGAQRHSEREYERTLRQQANDLGIADRVRFLGQRQDVPDLLASCDIVCQANEQPEHFGLIFVEGLAAGKPVVASRMGGPLEIINPRCGLLCEPNPDSLKSALESLIDSESLRHELGRHGPDRARALCNPSDRLNQLRQCLITASENRKDRKLKTH